MASRSGVKYDNPLMMAADVGDGDDLDCSAVLGAPDSTEYQGTIGKGRTSQAVLVLTGSRSIDGFVKICQMKGGNTVLEIPYTELHSFYTREGEATGAKPVLSGITLIGNHFGSQFASGITLVHKPDETKPGRETKIFMPFASAEAMAKDLMRLLELLGGGGGESELVENGKGD